VQSVQSGCCLYQATVALLYSCNCLWSAPLPARWGNSVLSTALILTKLAQTASTSPALRGWLIIPPPFSEFCLTSLLLSASSAALGGWLIAPPLLSFSESLAPCSTHSTLPPLSVLDCNLLFMLFSFVWRGRFTLPRGCAGLCSQQGGRGV
jgi:hypothetical protein